jgi:Glycosyltransferase family 87
MMGKLGLLRLGERRAHPRAWPAALSATSLGAAVWVALTAPGTGDYPADAGPAIGALLRGDLHAFASVRPAMGELSLLLRWPFAALGGPSALSVYRWGAIPCLLAVALLGLWLASIARARGTGMLGQAAIVAIALGNPLVQSALTLGHPEELLTASLAIAGIVTAFQYRPLATAILLGLAIASKQWAVVALFPALAACGASRLRILLGAASVVVTVTLPVLLVSVSAFVHTQAGLVTGRVLTPGAWSWLYLLSGTATLHERGGVVFRGPRMSMAVESLLHPLIIAAAVALAIAVAWQARRSLTADRLFAATALAFLLRCALDPGDQPYYHLPFLATLLAWDALRGERLPWRSLAATAVAYVLFERLSPSAVGTATASALYDAATAGAALVLARCLFAGAQRRVTPAPVTLGAARPKPA